MDDMIKRRFITMMAALIAAALLTAISTQAGSLHDAARVGDLQKLEQSLSDGAFVNAWDENPGMATIHPISLQSAIQAEQQAEAALSRAKDSSHDAEAVRAAEEALEQAWKYKLKMTSSFTKAIKSFPETMLILRLCSTTLPKSAWERPVSLP